MEAWNATLTASALGWTGSGTTSVINSAQVFDVETEYDEVALIFANCDPTYPLTVQGATISAGGSGGTCTVADLTNNSGFSTAGFHNTVTFGGGNASGIIPPSPFMNAGAPNGRFPGLLISDFTPLMSVPRSDVTGGRPLLYIRATIVPSNAAQKITFLRPTTTAGGGYAQTQTGYPNYERVCLSGEVNASASNLTGAGAITPAFGGSGNGCVVGFIYRSRSGRVMTVAAFGDSITNGSGTTNGFSWAQKVGYQLNIANAPAQNNLLMSSMPIETCCFGFPSQTAATYLQSFKALVDAGLQFNVAIMAPYTPNSASNGFISRQSFIDFAAECDNLGIYPMGWTGVPSPTLMTNAAFDTTRLAVNSWLLSGCDVGVMDFNAVVGGGTAATSASVTATIASGVMTISAVLSGTVAVNQNLSGTSVPNGTYITSIGTFNGTSGTVNISNSTISVATGETVTCTGGIQQYAAGMGYTDNTHPSDLGDTTIATNVVQPKLQGLLNQYYGALTS